MAYGNSKSRSILATDSMIDGKKILAIIPARGGSKGVLRKNIRRLGGRPLIGWTIDAAHRSRLLDRVVISTDDEEIAAVAMSLGGDVPFMRPARIAGDDVSGLAPVLHALKKLTGYDYVVLLQPTSPFRMASDIDNCIERCHAKGAASCVSVVAVDKSPFWMFCIDDDMTMTTLLSPEYLYGKQRQDLPHIVVLNGAVFVARVSDFLSHKTFFFKNTVAYEMPRERSLDIDSLLDFEIAEFILQRKAHC